MLKGTAQAGDRRGEGRQDVRIIELCQMFLAVVTELVEGAEPGLLARAQADRAVVAYRRGGAAQAAELGRAALASATPRSST